MSVTISPPMFLQFQDPNNSGSPAIGFQLFTYQAGTSIKQSTWTDSTQITANANPMPLDGNGVAANGASSGVWGDPTLAYKFVWAPANDTDPPSSPIRTIDNIYFPLNFSVLTQNVLGLLLYPRTSAEIAASVTPVNFSYLPGVPERYQANTTPGTTDMTTGLQSAFRLQNVNLIGPYLTNGVISGLTNQTVTGLGPAVSTIKAGNSFPGASAILSWPSGTWNNINLSGFLLNGNAKAQNCLAIIGSSQGAVSNITLTGLQCALATAQQILLTFLTYSQIYGCAANGGTFALDLNQCFNTTVFGGNFHDGSTYAVRVLNCSIVDFYSVTMFNNPPGSGGTNSTGLLHVDSSYDCQFIGCTTEPQGASNVTAAEAVIDSASGPNACARIEFRKHRFFGLSTTKSTSAWIGITNAAYEVCFADCSSLKPAAGNSFQFSAQQDCQISNCVDLSTYDAVPFSPVTITNASGNPIWNAQQPGFFDFLQSNTRLIIGANPNGSALTTVLKGTQAMAGTTVAVAFGVTLSGSTYQVFLNGRLASTGWFFPSGNATTGFTINCTAAFTGNVDWMITL